MLRPRHFWRDCLAILLLLKLFFASVGNYFNNFVPIIQGPFDIEKYAV